jgi:hypothetical protein
LTGGEIESALRTLSPQLENKCKKVPKGLAPEFFIDAPRVLKHLFDDITETRVAFDKMTHSVSITEWILKHDPEFMRPIADVLKACF